MIATTLPKAFRRLTCLAFLGSLLALVAMPGAASAQVSANVRNACMGDYFQFCAGMEVGGQELRRCFNRNGSKLTGGCVRALVSAGEISQAEVNRRGGVPTGTRTASKSKRTATKVASRNAACFSGPSRPGARSLTTCRTATSNRRSTRQFARN